MTAREDDVALLCERGSGAHVARAHRGRLDLPLRGWTRERPAIGRLVLKLSKGGHGPDAACLRICSAQFNLRLAVMRKGFILTKPLTESLTHSLRILVSVVAEPACECTARVLAAVLPCCCCCCLCCGHLVWVGLMDAAGGDENTNFSDKSTEITR